MILLYQKDIVCTVASTTDTTEPTVTQYFNMNSFVTLSLGLKIASNLFLIPKFEGISFNMPVLIEVIEEKSKLEPLLPQIKRIVGDKGLATLQEVEAL
jgi:hypothetical protein